jgi:malate permease and related proteins
MTASILLAIAEIFVFFAIGWFSNKLGLIREEYLDNLTSFVITFLLPPLIFSRIVINIDAGELLTLWTLPVIGFGMMVLGGGLSILLDKGLKEKNIDIVRTFRHFCAVNNFGFFPIIVIGRLWGEDDVAKLFLLHLGSYIGFWSIGISLLGKASIKTTVKNIINPPLITILVAVTVILLEIGQRIPDFFMSIFEKTGAAAVPFVLMLIGAGLHGLPRGEELRDIAYLSFVRLIFLPALIVTVLLLLPLAEDIYRIATVVSLMPVGLTSVVITRKYGGSPRFASHSAVVTTILSAITIPVSILILF